MSSTVTDALLAAATKLSERTANNGCAGSPRPPSRSMVRVAGPSPFRVLVLGSGPVVGFGVLSHELALSGHLARGVSDATGCGIDVDVVTEIGLHARDLLTVMAAVVPERYDLVILSVGTQDVLDCTPLEDWSADVERVLDLLGATERATPVEVIAVPQISKVMGLEPVLARAADRRARGHNLRLQVLCGSRPGFTFVPFPLDGDAEYCHQRTSDTYCRWADVLMAGISPVLGSLRHEGRPERQEEGRQAAVDRLGILDTAPDAVLDSITHKARRMFGTVGAGISLIDHDRQSMVSSSGVAVPTIQRSDSICNVTITTNAGVVVEDAALDPRFAGGYFVVTARLRSYAGIPIRDPHGYMIAALCVYDGKPRMFQPADLALLRHLAHLVEERLLILA